MKDQVIIFIFIKDQKILIEKRTLEDFEGEQYLIPGGKVKDLENLEQALERELSEELGIKILDFIPLPTGGEILGLRGQSLIPFLIQKWEGEIPESILDKGNSLEWIDIEEVLNSPVKPTREIVQALKEYLSKK